MMCASSHNQWRSTPASSPQSSGWSRNFNIAYIIYILPILYILILPILYTQLAGFTLNQNVGFYCAYITGLSIVTNTYQRH